MLKSRGLDEDGVFSVKAGGKVTREEYERLLRVVEDLLQNHDSLRFYIKLVDFSGLEARALWDDLKFDFKHKNQYGKTAIVGDQKWEEWATKLSGMFFDAEMKFFQTDQSDKAWTWIHS